MQPEQDPRTNSVSAKIILVVAVIAFAAAIGYYFGTQSPPTPTYITQIQEPPTGGEPCVLVPENLVGNNSNQAIGNSSLFVIRNYMGFIYLVCGGQAYYYTPTLIWNNSLGISQVVCYEYYCYLQVPSPG